MPIAEPPPQLWSMQVWGEPHPGHAIKICADARLRAGFALRSLQSAGRPCPTYSLSLNYKCHIDGREFGLSTLLTGDLNRDFVAHSSVTDIDAQKTVYNRALRFKLLGVCPKGWPIGDATNQQGKRVVAAFVAGTNDPAYPRR
jgi:hypothetical protein